MSLFSCQASLKARTVAVPEKSSTMIFPHSELSLREIWRETWVTTQANSIDCPRKLFRFAVVTGAKASTTDRYRSRGCPEM